MARSLPWPSGPCRRRPAHRAARPNPVRRGSPPALAYSTAMGGGGRPSHLDPEEAALAPTAGTRGTARGSARSVWPLALAALALGAATLPACRRAGEGPTRGGRGRPPNILLITLDTLRADHVSSYARSPVATPHLDGLARRGARFTRAFAQVPLTTPSHASILTGTLPSAHGIRDNGGFALAPGVRPSPASPGKPATRRQRSSPPPSSIASSASIAASTTTPTDVVRATPRARRARSGSCRAAWSRTAPWRGWRRAGRERRGPPGGTNS